LSLDLVGPHALTLCSELVEVGETAKDSLEPLERMTGGVAAEFNPAHASRLGQSGVAIAADHHRQTGVIRGPAHVVRFEQRRTCAKQLNGILFTAQRADRAATEASGAAQRADVVADRIAATHCESP
jgi:hypothetical protein